MAGSVDAAVVLVVDGALAAEGQPCRRPTALRPKTGRADAWKVSGARLTRSDTERAGNARTIGGASECQCADGELDPAVQAVAVTLE